MTMMKVLDDNNGESQLLTLQWPIQKTVSDEMLGNGKRLDLNTANKRENKGNHKAPAAPKSQSVLRQGREKQVFDDHCQPKKRRISISLRHYTAILFLTLYALTMETDASMSDASASSKRPAPISSLGAAKKRIEGEQSPSAKQTRFIEPEPDETIVSTKINRHTENPFLESLTETALNMAKTPYESLFGEDKGDPKALHDDLQTILTLAGRWVYDTAMMTQEQL
jgi:hypothetical protein